MKPGRLRKLCSIIDSGVGPDSDGPTEDTGDGSRMNGRPATACDRSRDSMRPATAPATACDRKKRRQEDRGGHGSGDQKARPARPIGGLSWISHEVVSEKSFYPGFPAEILGEKSSWRGGGSNSRTNF